MKKSSLKITALLLGWMSFSALAEQTVDIEIRGIKGERAIRNTDMNVNLIDKGEMDGSDPVSYTHLDVYKRQEEYRPNTQLLQRIK